MSAATLDLPLSGAVRLLAVWLRALRKDWLWAEEGVCRDARDGSRFEPTKLVK
jgi:hypothetical protein